MFSIIDSHKGSVYVVDLHHKFENNIIESKTTYLQTFTIDPTCGCTQGLPRLHRLPWGFLRATYSH
jgi:hypothetical protein